MRTPTKIKLAATIILVFTAFFSALAALEEVKLVIVITLFFGGFGAGATLVSFINDLKQNSK